MWVVEPPHQNPTLKDDIRFTASSHKNLLEKWQYTFIRAEKRSNYFEFHKENLPTLSPTFFLTAVAVHPLVLSTLTNWLIYAFLYVPGYQPKIQVRGGTGRLSDGLPIPLILPSPSTNWSRPVDVHPAHTLVLLRSVVPCSLPWLGQRMKICPRLLSISFMIGSFLER